MINANSSSFKNQNKTKSTFILRRGDKRTDVGIDIGIKESENDDNEREPC